MLSSNKKKLHDTLLYLCMYIYFLFIVLFVIREGILEVRGNFLSIQNSDSACEMEIISSGVESLFLLYCSLVCSCFGCAFFYMLLLFLL